MEEPKYRKYYLDWWRIRKSTIYTLIAILVIVGTVVGGSWYALRNNWFSQENVTNTPKDAARIISFEGDVRIIRAATRETIVVTKDTYVAAGDTVQTQADGVQELSRILGGGLRASGYDVHHAFLFRRTAAFDHHPNVFFCARDWPRSHIVLG